MYLCLHLCIYIYLGVSKNRGTPKWWYIFVFISPHFQIQPLWFSKTLRVGAVLTNWMSWPTCRAFPAYYSSGRRPLLPGKCQKWRFWRWFSISIGLILMFPVNFQWVQGFIWALWKHIPSECVLGRAPLGGQCGRWIRNIYCVYKYVISVLKDEG